MSVKVENNCKVNPVKVPLETDQGIIESEKRKWGMPLKEVYKHGLAFFLEKEGKALHLSYEDRLKLVGYTQQAAHGPFDPNSVSPLGVLDVIGRDRRAAWQALGQMSQVQAMAGFVHTLDRLCPLFKPYLEAFQKELEDKKEQELKKAEVEKAHQELQNRVMLEKQKQQSNKLSEEDQVQRIKDALNAQTYEQFLEYAQQQFPGNFDQQAVLIRQLQDQHYQQYIQQLAVDQRLANCTISNVNDEEGNPNTDVIEAKEVVKDCNLNETAVTVENAKKSGLTRAMQTIEKTGTYYDDVEHVAKETETEEDGDGDDVFPVMEEARMWTSGDINKFKETAREGGGTLTVGHGETVTVRVPTHPRANKLCWEFATDNYDIGFGLYFEWSKCNTTEVTIHVSETDDEDDAEDDAEIYPTDNVLPRGVYDTNDPELGPSERSTLTTPSQKPFISNIVPIYRRDCHTEVYAGSHTYPGEGVYLLKFDNTYSLWRSKTLYYKLYYTQ